MGSLQEQLLKAGLVSKQHHTSDNNRKSPPDGNEGGVARGGKQADTGGRKPRGQQQRGPGVSTTNKQNYQPGELGAGPHAKKAGKKAGTAKAGSDLEAAYRARAHAEKREREERKAKLVAEQEQRRARNVQLSELVEGRQLNDEQAEIPRYFNYMHKIRRILLTAGQLQAVNNGELGIAVLRSKPILLDTETLAEFRRIAPDLVPELGGEEPSAAQWDEQYQGFEVPDDLRW